MEFLFHILLRAFHEFFPAIRAAEEIADPFVARPIFAGVYMHPAYRVYWHNKQLVIFSFPQALFFPKEKGLVAILLVMFKSFLVQERRLAGFAHVHANQIIYAIKGLNF